MSLAISGSYERPTSSPSSHAGVDADPGRRRSRLTRPVCGRNVRRILGVEPSLDRMARCRDVEVDLPPPRNAELELHDVEPRHLLTDRVLDLDAPVELEEVHVRAVDQKLCRPRALVRDCGCERSTSLPRSGYPRRRIEVGWGRLLDELLMTTLDEQSRPPSTAMPRLCPRSCASMCRGRSRKRSQKTVSSPKAASASRRAAASASSRSSGWRTTRIPAPAAAGRRLDQERKSDLVGRPLGTVGTPLSRRDAFCGELVAYRGGEPRGRGRPT